MRGLRYLLSFSIFLILTESSAQGIIAHAHNDYLNEKPLIFALQNGFHSIEVDIYEYQGEIVVSHYGNNLKSKPTLRSLYLEPLRDFLHGNQAVDLWLLIDLKQEDESLLDLLHEQIQELGNLFKSKKSSELRPVQIVLSGSVQRQLIAETDFYEYFYLDGRIHHLESESWDSYLMPLISANITNVVKWNGKNEINAEDKKRINDLVFLANSQGKKLRFWKTRDSEDTWVQLREMGVHVIGTDEVEALAQFIKKD